MFSSSSFVLLLSSLFLLLLLVIVLPSNSHQQQLARTRTVTYQVLRPGSVYITKQDMDALRLRRAGVFPQAFINLEILNSTFTTDTTDCKNALGSMATLVTGPDWLPAELFADIPLTQPSTYSNQATLHFKGSALFDARNNAKDGSTYNIRLPSVCTSSQLSGPVSFTLTETPSTRLSELLAFLILLAGTLGFLAVLFGMSIYAYVPVQIAVLLVSCGCGPLDLQLESYTVGFVLSPLPYTSRDTMPHYHMILTNLLIFFILTVVEIIHFVVRWVSTPAYAPRLLASLKGRRGAFLSNFRPRADDPYPVPPEDVPRRPMPFYFLFSMFVTIGGGLFYHAIRVLSYEAVEIQHYGAAAVAMVVWFVFFGLCLTLSLTKGAFYKPFASTKKVLPRIITPDGVTGPNVFRLSFGVIVSDMRQGRRYASTFPMIYISILGILIAATSPSSTGCRTTLSLSWLLTFLFGLFVYRSKPLRSAASNIFAVGALVAALVAISCMLAYGGYGGSAEDPYHWSGRGAIVATIVMCFISICNSLLVLVTGYVVEFAGSEAQRTAKYSDGRGGVLSVGLNLEGDGDDNNNDGNNNNNDGVEHTGNDIADGRALGATGAEQFERHVAFIVGEMKSIIDVGGGQPLEPDETTGGGGRGGGVGSHLQAPTLAQFLIQDFEALPDETQQSIVTSERLNRQSQFHFSGSGRNMNNNNGVRSLGGNHPDSRKKKKQHDAAYTYSYL